MALFLFFSCLFISIDGKVCTGGDCTCDSGSNCVLDCTSGSICKDDQLTCPDGFDCTVNCVTTIAATEPCIGATINAQTSHNVILNCNSFNGCKDLIINCPDGYDCTIQCLYNNACENIQIKAALSNVVTMDCDVGTESAHQVCWKSNIICGNECNILCNGMDYKQTCASQSIDTTNTKIFSKVCDNSCVAEAWTVTTTAPTSAIPTTAIPTTNIPTTVMPTTAPPTTTMPTTAIPTTNIPTTSMPTTAMPTPTAAPTTSTVLMPSEQQNGRVDTISTTATIDGGLLEQENKSSDSNVVIIVLVVIIIVLMCVIAGLLMYRKYMQKNKPNNVSIEMQSSHTFKAVMTGEGEVEGDGVDIAIPTTTDMGYDGYGNVPNGTSSFVVNNSTEDGNIKHTNTESDGSYESDDIYKDNLTPNAEMLTPKDTKGNTLMSKGSDELDKKIILKAKNKF